MKYSAATRLGPRPNRSRIRPAVDRHRSAASVVLPPLGRRETPAEARGLGEPAATLEGLFGLGYENENDGGVGLLAMDRGVPGSGTNGNFFWSIVKAPRLRRARLAAELARKIVPGLTCRQ